jgi:hypothetical protein
MKRLYVIATKAIATRYLEKFPGHVITTTSNIEAAIAVAKSKSAIIVISAPAVSTMQKCLDERIAFVDVKKYHLNHLAVRLTHAMDVSEDANRHKFCVQAAEERRKRGLPLGAQNPNTLKGVLEAQGWKSAHQASVEKRAELADEHVKSMERRIRQLRAKGATWDSIAEQMNEEGYRTRRGCEHTHTSVYKAFRRLEGDNFKYEIGENATQ